MAELLIQRLEKVGCKTALRLAERALSTTGTEQGDPFNVLATILDDLASDQAASERLCEVVL